MEDARNMGWSWRDMLPAMILDPPQQIGSKMPDSSEFSEPTLHNHPILQTKKLRFIHPHGPSWPSLARWKPLRPGKVRKRKSRTSWSSGRGSTPMSGKKSLISCTAAWPKDREEGDPSLQSVKRGCPGLLAWLGYTFASWERERDIYIYIYIYIHMHVFVCVLAHVAFRCETLPLRGWKRHQSSWTSGRRNAKETTRTWWTYCAFLLCRIYLLVELIILRCTNLPASSSIYILSNISTFSFGCINSSMNHVQHCSTSGFLSFQFHPHLHGYPLVIKHV